MNAGRMVFSQLIGFLPDRDFRRCVQHYNGNYATEFVSRKNTSV